MRSLDRDGTVARQIRALFGAGATGGLADAELLERFAAGGGDAAESAFAALVERHGPMVLRACRAASRDPDDADDAFQATFLVLARRAGSLWVRDSLGPWLHTVACRVASGVRSADGRRRGLERRAAKRASLSAGEGPRDDLGPALHEEVERLPERLRAPVVLCYLEGLTHEQAAEHLACPVGTVRSRLARGRERLRRGLHRRGFAPPSHQLDPASPAKGAVPAPLAGLTVLAAARSAAGRATVGPVARWSISLLERIVSAMSMHPLRSFAVLLLSAGALAAGLGHTGGQEPREKPAPPPVDAPRDRPDSARRDADRERFEAMEARLRALERKLEAIEDLKTATRPAGVDPRTLVKVRPRLDNILVEKVFVAAGRQVKKGDPLFEFRSTELAQARNDLRFKFVQWDRDFKFLKGREPLAREGRITQPLWVDTQNDEKKSRLDYLIGREKLANYGMTDEQIDKLLVGLSDDPKGKDAPMDDLGGLKMTLSSPVDGRVAEVVAEPGSIYGLKDVLAIIAGPKP